MASLKRICVRSGSAILEASVSTPIGVLKLTSCQEGLHSIEHDESIIPNDENFLPNSKWNSNKSSEVEMKPTTPHLEDLIKWMQSYFKTPSPKVEPESNFVFCFLSSTDFEQEVLMALFKGTNVGDTITYHELAEKVNRPNASRAVGTVMKKNPFPIVIPCHRVIRSDGTIGQYSGGRRNKIKEFLLEHEKGYLTE